MSDSNITEYLTSPAQSDSNLKEYSCPHCNKFLFRGKVKRLNMVCHHCQKRINNDENELFQLEINQETD